jgi:hypothetical protein
MTDDGQPVLIADLFPHDDLISQWVFQLTAVTADLVIADTLLHEALSTDASSAHTGYHYRQVLARLYEARRPIITFEAEQEIQDWARSLADTSEPLELLRGAYLPAGKSVVDQAYGLARHRTVHHAWVGSDELAEILRVAADQQAWCVMDHDNLQMHYEWPEAAVTATLAGDLGADDDLVAFANRAVFAQGLLEAFMGLSLTALAHHTGRVGVDARRFTKQVGTPRGPGTAG